MKTPAAVTEGTPARRTAPTLPDRKKGRIDLLATIPGLRWIVTRRWFQFVLVLPMLLMFLVLLAAGFFGSPVGNRNGLIIVVWILWWFFLISLMVPFASRIWCTVCPFPFFGEWFQRRALIKPRAVEPGKKGGAGVVIGRNRYFGRNRRWPKALSNIWLQNVGFLLLCTFSALLLTRPIVSAVVLSGIILGATVLHLLFRHRAFCSYVCPVSGFLSLYSMASTLEVRSKDSDTCAKCKDKGCLAGGERGWGCPWLMYPSKMTRNNYCGLCMECIKTCPYENMTVNLRPFCSDTTIKGYDEAWKAFIMLGLALAYSLIYLGPFGGLKDLANPPETGLWGGFLLYALSLWATALVLVPGIYALAVQSGRWLAGKGGGTASPRPVFKESFLALVYPLVPLGLLAWVAFSLPLVMVNGSYILMVLSDPFGWGWDLFGTAHVEWTPVVPYWAPTIQVVLLLVGLAFGLRSGYRLALGLYGDTGRALRAFGPVSVLLAVFVAVFIFLYAG